MTRLKFCLVAILATGIQMLWLAPVPAMAAQLFMANESAESLTLIVDGKQGCTAAPGQRCATDVAPGDHGVRAQAQGGQATDARLSVPELGLIWTVRYFDAGGEFWVQAGSYAVEANAEAARSKLSALGDVDVVARSTAKGVFHRVRVGPVKTKSEAEQLKAKVEAAGFKGASIIAF